MKLIWHEFKTLTLQWKWLIPLWWLLVFSDFGYQSGWFWEGPLTWKNYSDLHESARDIIRLLIVTGIGLSVYVIAAANSPHRENAAKHLRPVRRFHSFLSAFLFLCIFLGLPWWIHEAIYLHQIADQTAGFALRGTTERILSTLITCLAFGVLGWVSGTLHRGIRIITVAFLAYFAFALYEESALHSLTYFDADSNRVVWWERFASLTTFVLLATAAIALLFWHWATHRFAVLGGFRGWVLLFVMLVLSPLSHLLSFQLLTSWLIRSATAQNSEESSAMLRDLPVSSLFLFNKNEHSPTRWELNLPSPESSNLLPDIVAAKGTVELSDGSTYQLTDIPHDGGFPEASKFGGISDLDYLEEFSEFTIYGGRNQASNHDTESATLYPDKTEKHNITAANFQSAQAELTLELLRRQEWLRLPLDGSPHPFGSLGSARFAKWQSGQLFILTRCPSAFTEFKDGIKPFRQFAVINRKRKELILLHNHPDQPDLILGTGSAAPLFLWRLHYSNAHNQVPSFVKTKAWQADAELLLLEASLVGRVERTITNQNDPVDWTHFHPQSTVYPLFGTDQGTARKEWPWQDGQASEKEVQRAIYELVRDKIPEGQPIPPFHPNHRTLFRNSALEVPGLIPPFKTSWTEKDRDLFLHALTLENTQKNYDLATNLLQCDWLHLRPDWVEKTLATGTPSFRDHADTAMTKQDPEKKRHLQYRRSLSTFNSPPVLKETYPEIWREEEERNLKIWNEGKHFYRMPFRGFNTADLTLARMGYEEPLRQRLQSYITLGSKISEEEQSNYLHNGSIWKWIEALFGVPKERTIDDKTERLEKARSWLDSEWEFQPESMTYQILP